MGQIVFVRGNLKGFQTLSPGVADSECLPRVS